MIDELRILKEARHLIKEGVDMNFIERWAPELEIKDLLMEILS